MKAEPEDVRLWRRVDKSGDCWLWTGGRLRQGYGLISTRRNGTRTTKLVHRVSWELHNGAIPDGIHVLHRCDNPPCVRPEHLFLGDNAANVADRVAKSRSRGAVGARNPKAKLTQEQVEDIRRRWRPGPLGRPTNGPSLTAQLADEYGVTKSTIDHIGRRWTWHE